MMQNAIKVDLPSSKARVCINYAGGCYIEFWNGKQPNSIAHTIAPEDLLPLAEALRTASQRQGMRDDEA